MAHENGTKTAGQQSGTFAWDVCVVGGAGHVGAPLSVVCAVKGFRTLIYDLNSRAMEILANGTMPFFEEGGEALLRQALEQRTLDFSADIADVARSRCVVLTIGTPIDEFHNPTLRVVRECVDSLIPHISDAQTIVLRSTVFPGVTDFVRRYLASHGKHPRIAFCPERVVQGFAIRELLNLPQIISGCTPEAEEHAAEIFSRIAPKLIRMQTKEAEFAKLFCNAYRYVQFAITNQFYMMVESAGLNYRRILDGIKEDYPRMSGLAKPGFVAGPCLYKDTLQLAAWADDRFPLGHAAIEVNEGLPAFIVRRLSEQRPLHETTVGLLGMAFKPDSDDIRASLSYKLKKLLEFSAREVLTTDPLVKNDPALKPLDYVLERSDVLILCVPHSAYLNLAAQKKPIIDVWGALQSTQHDGLGSEPSGVRSALGGSSNGARAVERDG